MEEDDIRDDIPATPEEDDVMKELEDAMHKMHPEEAIEADSFATDGLGQEPAEEDDMGRS